MKENSTNSEEWKDCPPGSLDRVVHYAARRRRHQAIRSLTLIAAFSCVLIVAYALVFTAGPTTNDYGDISCAEVAERLEDYQADRVPPELADRIAAHLEQCPVCRQGIARHQRTTPIRSVAGTRRARSTMQSKKVAIGSQMNIATSNKRI